MVTGHLREKNGVYHIVFNYKDENGNANNQLAFVLHIGKIRIRISGIAAACEESGTHQKYQQHGNHLFHNRRSFRFGFDVWIIL